MYENGVFLQNQMFYDRYLYSLLMIDESFPQLQNISNQFG